MLTSFCKWQTLMNQYDSSGPKLYDAAILITRLLNSYIMFNQKIISRENICKKPNNSNGGCDALGLAEIGNNFQILGRFNYIFEPRNNVLKTQLHSGAGQWPEYCIYNCP